MRKFLSGGIPFFCVLSLFFHSSGVSQTQLHLLAHVDSYSGYSDCWGYTAPNGDVVSQPGTSIKLDSLGDRLMQKVQYRQVGATESLC